MNDNEYKICGFTRLCLELIKKHRNLLYKNLSKKELDILDKVISFLRNSRTGPKRKPPKNHYKLISFYFISLSYPVEAPVLNDTDVMHYKKAFKKILDKCFGENGKYGVSYHACVHYKNNDHRQKSPHFHIVLSRLLEDKEQVNKEYKEFDALDEDIKPLNSLYFLKNFITLPNKEVLNLIEKEWINLLHEKNAINSKTIGSTQLIGVTGEDDQDLEQSFAVEYYVKNDSLRPFKDVNDIWEDEKGLICIKKSGKNHTIPVLEFIRHYLLQPNHNFGTSLRWSGYGSLCGNSRFSRILDYATLLPIHGKFIHDHSVSEIIEKAKERDRLLAGDRETKSDYEHRISNIEYEIQKLKYEMPAKYINEPNSDWLEEYEINNRRKYEYSLLFTFSHIPSGCESDVRELLDNLFFRKNVKCLQCKDNSEKMLFIINKTSYCEEKYFTRLLNKYESRFNKNIKSLIKRHEKGYRITKLYPKFVAVEWFPYYFYTFHCYLKNEENSTQKMKKKGFLKKPSKTTPHNNKRKMPFETAIIKTFNVDNYEVKTVDDKEVYIVTIPSSLDKRRIKKSIREYQHKLEQHYNRNYRTKKFNSYSTHIELVETNKWSC